MKRYTYFPLLSFSAFVAATVVIFPITQAQATLNTATIMASSASQSCHEYRVVGVCYWLYCSYGGCRVRASIKVRHYLPEMVISSYNHENQNPWKEMNMLSKGVHAGEYSSPQKKYSQLNFKNADAIGHPQGAISQMLKNTGYYCKTQTKPFVPYFLSGLDFLAWRENMPEMFYPEALIPGMREVRSNGDLWGNMYPRSGAVTQVHDYKAAAVIAQRVADIVSRTGQPHIYQASAQRGGEGYWPPPAVKENDKTTHKWQMLYPNMSRSCAIFPDGSPQDGYAPQLSELGNYAWALWRPYSCCKRRGQTFLFSTDWGR
ncbi:conjugal transfer protein [Chelonobacter oris]|uniref:TIGR03756 family integrating conjugative element protein n=1 Tax=Chelonobacter oris TaxID=505317 RepID=UPI002447DD4B|nr:TIGR03756 family integrating conjugative element protein [Chelonobacter oris]MDH3000183.1 conjugal transfer protein [Chelonobacter oris]